MDKLYDPKAKNLNIQESKSTYFRNYTRIYTLFVKAYSILNKMFFADLNNIDY